MKVIIIWFAGFVLLLQLLKDAGLEKYPSMAKQESAIIHKIYFPSGNKAFMLKF